MKELLLKAIKCLLPLFGVAVFDSCAVKAEYGCPHADFEAKGVVTDEDGNAIKGIRVALSAERPDYSYFNTPLRDTLWTNENGEYKYEYTLDGEAVYSKYDATRNFYLPQEMVNIPQVTHFQYMIMHIWRASNLNLRTSMGRRTVANTRRSALKFLSLRSRMVTEIGTTVLMKRELM